MTNSSSTLSNERQTPQGQMKDNFSFSPVSLLYCVIGLLIIITILLLIILLKRYCKKCKGNIPALNIEGGTFRMGERNCNVALDNLKDDTAIHSDNLPTYTASNDDSSSTSSGSTCHSNGGKHSESNPQYISLKTPLPVADYENVCERKRTSSQDFKNKKAKKNPDYVNIEEEKNLALARGRKNKANRHQDESETSSESSSDISDNDSVNYSIVVFKEAPNPIQRE